MRQFLLLLLLLNPAVLSAAEFAVVRSAAPTSNGATHDFTSTGFGTPKCAIATVTYGTANGTAVNGAFQSFGFYDGTRSYSLTASSDNGADPMDTGQVTNTSNMLQTYTSSQSVDGTAQASFITDGLRLTWADAPPSAYIVTVVLIGGTGVSNCYTNTASSPSTQDTATTITAPGFQPDIVMVLTPNAFTASLRYSFGVVVNDGSNTQRSMSNGDTNGNATSSQSGTFSTSRVGNSPIALGALSISNFTSTGFDLFLRDATGTAQTNVGYLAIKLNGLGMKLLTTASPTSTGSATITGAGFTPQFAMLMQGSFPAIDTNYTADEAEALGLGFMTASASACASIYIEDGAAVAVTESITNTKPICLRKDAALYMEADFTAFTSDGVTLNYGTTQGSATQRAILFVEAQAVATRPPGLQRRFAR